jgi:hypothetical protein
MYLDAVVKIEQRKKDIEGGVVVVGILTSSGRLRSFDQAEFLPNWRNGKQDLKLNTTSPSPLNSTSTDSHIFPSYDMKAQWHPTRK